MVNITIMSKICRNCGAALRRDSKFCMSCGTQVINDDLDLRMNAGISAENLFGSTVESLSDLFVYNKLGREFTGDISYIRDSVFRNNRSIDKGVLVHIADSNMSSVRRVFSKISNELSNDNWTNVLFMLRNGIPIALTAYFFDKSSLDEVRMMLDRMKVLSKLRWEKTSFLGKSAVPTADFEDIYTLRFLMNNIRF